MATMKTYGPRTRLRQRRNAAIPVADVQEAAAKAKASHKIVDVVVYPDSPHGFHADYRPSFNRTDAEDGWKRAIAWFKHYGVAPKDGTQAA